MMYIPLLKERSYMNIKFDFEAELAFATMSLGFVEFDKQYAHRVINLVKDYTKLEKGNNLL